MLLYILFFDFVGQMRSNIALHKPAFQQNTFTIRQYEPDAGRFDASNAVDGLKFNLTALGGQCTISANNKTTAIWWVNLINTLQQCSLHYNILQDGQ